VSKSQFENADAFINHFVKSYTDKFKTRPIVNRSKFKYAVVDMLKDIKLTEAKTLADYYISHYTEVSISEFLYKYDEMIQEMNAEEADLMQREQLLSETQSAVQRFRERYGKN